MSDLNLQVNNNIKSILLSRTPKGRYIVYDNKIRTVNTIGGECFQKSCSERSMDEEWANKIWKKAQIRINEGYKRGWLYYQLLEDCGGDKSIASQLTNTSMKWMIAGAIMKHRNMPEKADVSGYDLGSADGKYDPKDHQLEGIQKIIGNGGRMLLADEPGAGKTMQATQAINIMCDKIIFVCKAKLRGEMVSEIKKWNGKDQDIYIVDGNSDKIDGDWCIMSYDVMKSYIDEIKEKEYDGIIMDESECIKNRSTQRTRAALKLRKHIPCKVLLSGTPVPNSIDEAWPQLRFIGHWAGEKFSYREFCRHFAGGMEVNFGGRSVFKEYNEKHSNPDLLRESMKDCTLRRNKDIKASIDREWYKIDVTEEWRREENMQLSSLKEEYESLDEEGHLLGRIQSMRVIAAKAKATFVADKLIDVCKADKSKSIAVFCDFKEPIKYIKNALVNDGIDCGVIDGDTSDDKVEEVKERFMEGNIPVIILSKSGEHGHNLQIGDEIWFVSLSWNPKSHIQKRDRAFRIGREGDLKERWFECDLEIDQVTADKIKSKQQMQKDIGMEATESEIMNERGESYSLKNIAQELIDRTKDLSFF